MARGQQSRTVRAALSGRNTGRPPVVVPAATPEARAAVRRRAVGFISDYTMSVGAELRHMLHEADAAGDTERAEFMVHMAEKVSDILGDEFHSRPVPTGGTLCAGDPCTRGATRRAINRGDRCIARTHYEPGPHEFFHPECVPASGAMGFNRHDEGADAEAWLLAAFARLDAGYVSPHANYWLRCDRGLIDPDA